MALNYEYIGSGPEYPAAFTLACDELASAQFILSETRIRNILKTIAASRRLLSVFANAVAGFNFDAEFTAAVTQTEARRILTLPSVPKKYIAFVYSLFLRIDQRKIDIHKLLKEYYAAEDDELIDECLSKFTAAVVPPFKELVIAAYSDLSIPDIEIK